MNRTSWTEPLPRRKQSPDPRNEKRFRRKEEEPRDPKDLQDFLAWGCEVPAWLTYQ
jgi:hypothetical protein